MPAENQFSCRFSTPFAVPLPRTLAQTPPGPLSSRERPGPARPASQRPKISLQRPRCPLVSAVVPVALSQPNRTIQRLSPASPFASCRLLVRRSISLRLLVLHCSKCPCPVQL